MIETPATQPLPTTPIEQFESHLRHAHDSQRELRDAIGSLSSFVGNELIGLPPTDENLDLLFDALDKAKELDRTLQIPEHDGGLDGLPKIIANLEKAIEQFKLEGAFSWRSPSCRNIDLIYHGRQITLTDAFQKQWSSLPGIKFDELEQLPSNAAKLPEYLLRELSEEVIELNSETAILTGRCVLPSPDSKFHIGKHVVEFSSIASLMTQEASHVRAARANGYQQRQNDHVPLGISSPINLDNITEDRRRALIETQRIHEEERRRYLATRSQ